jgi:pyrroline-5-carboxylate reductase
MIKYNLGPIIIYPRNKKVEKFFSRLGEIFSTNDEKENKKLWVMTSFMATYLEIFNTASKWLQNKNIKKNKSIKYLSNLFKGLNHEISANSKLNNDKLVKDFQTKGGINEELLLSVKKLGVFKNLNKSFEKIYFRIKKN